MALRLEWNAVHHASACHVRSFSEKCQQDGCGTAGRGHNNLCGREFRVSHYLYLTEPSAIYFGLSSWRAAPFAWHIRPTQIASLTESISFF